MAAIRSVAGAAVPIPRSSARASENSAIGAGVNPLEPTDARNSRTRLEQLPIVRPSFWPKSTPAISRRSFKIGPPESPCRAVAFSSTNSLA